MYKHARCFGECSSTRQRGRPRRMADRAAAPQTAPPALPPLRACFSVMGGRACVEQVGSVTKDDSTTSPANARKSAGRFFHSHERQSFLKLATIWLRSWKRRWNQCSDMGMLGSARSQTFQTLGRSCSYSASPSGASVGGLGSGGGGGAVWSGPTQMS